VLRGFGMVPTGVPAPHGGGIATATANLGRSLITPGAAEGAETSPRGGGPVPPASTSSGSEPMAGDSPSAIGPSSSTHVLPVRVGIPPKQAEEDAPRPPTPRS